MCFQNDGKTAQAARCIISRIMTKVIDYVLSIDTFEQQCVVLKGMLQSPRLKYHVQTIGIDQSLSNNALYEHKCLQNTNKLYKHAGKCDDQQKFKDIIEVNMVSNPEGFTNNSPIYLMTPTPVKKPSARKSLCLFNNILYLKNKAATCRVRAAKSKSKEIKSGTIPWSLNPKQKVNSMIIDQIKNYLYNWIMHNPQVLQSLIFNDFMKVNIDGHIEPQIVP